MTKHLTWRTEHLVTAGALTGFAAVVAITLSGGGGTGGDEQPSTTPAPPVLAHTISDGSAATPVPGAAPMPLPVREFNQTGAEASGPPPGQAPEDLPVDVRAPNRWRITTEGADGTERTGAPEADCAVPTRFAPARLYVPSLCVSAPVEQAGAERGRMVLPENPTRVAHLDSSAAVGAKQGTAVVAGHVNYRGRLGSLYDVAQLRPGAKVYLTDGRGRPSAYRVVSLRHHPKGDLPADIFTTSGPSRLALVTCGGILVHDGTGSHYQDNVVATAVRVQDADG